MTRSRLGGLIIMGANENSRAWPVISPTACVFHGTKIGCDQTKQSTLEKQPL